MPIDIKWIRNHAQQVQTWQQQRGRLNEEAQQLVTRTVQLDQDCRQRLHHIRVLRESINKLSKQLRSVVIVVVTTTHEEDEQQQQQRRVELVQQRQDLQISVTREETLYQEQQATLHKLLWRLASPIDNVITDTYPPLDNSNINNNNVNHHHRIHPSSSNNEKKEDDEEMIVLDLSQNTGWRLAQAIMAVSINDFGSKYGQIHSLSSCKELFKSSTTTTTTTNTLSLQELDLFHAMWGCTSTTSGPSSCFLCTCPPATQQQEQKQHQAALPPPLLESVPLWIPFMATAIPKKSIFGAKQLPQYTLLQDIGELDLQIVAITAGTTWDARQVQQQLAHELMTLYEQFLVVDYDDDKNSSSNRPTERIQLWACSPSQLALHEQSRIVLTLRGGGTTMILGWVSNYGDAAARACEWYFQGGGRHDTKDYVHVIHASIVSPHTIQQLLQSNIHHDQNRIRIPPIVQQQLCGGGSTSLQEDVLVPEDSIPLEAVRSSKDILAVPRRAAQPRDNNNNNNNMMMRMSKPRSIVFPQWEPRTIHPSGLGKKWKDAEALACPFGFLI
jgi:hypothetical protein